MLDRIREPSTWAAVAAALAALAATAPSQYANALWVGMAVSTVAGIILPERKPLPAA